jgi:hypothetical protein
VIVSRNSRKAGKLIWQGSAGKLRPPALCDLVWSALIGMFRSRASPEVEILILRHQLNVLRRKSPK